MRRTASILVILGILNGSVAQAKDRKLHSKALEMLQEEEQERLGLLPAKAIEYVTVEEFVTDLKNNDEWTLHNTLAVRGAKVGEAAVPTLIELLSADKQETKVRAALVLGKLGCPEVIVPALVEAYHDPDPRFHSAVVGALIEIGPEAKAAVPTLLKALDDPAEPHSTAVAFALWRSAQDPRAVEKLIELLADENPRERSIAADFLRMIGPKHIRRAVPALMKARQDEDATVRSVALGTLVELVPPEEALILVVEAGMDEDPRVRSKAIRLLKKLHADAPHLIHTEQSE